MGGQRGKRKNPGVGVDFKRVKHKVGKSLPKAQNDTNTDIHTRAINLPSQSVLLEKEGLAVSSRNLTLKARRDQRPPPSRQPPPEPPRACRGRSIAAGLHPAPFAPPRAGVTPPAAAHSTACAERRRALPLPPPASYQSPFSLLQNNDDDRSCWRRRRTTPTRRAAIR
jgi:hypothetical protein